MTPGQRRVYNREWQRRWRRQQGMVPWAERPKKITQPRPPRLSEVESRARKKARYAAKRAELIAYQRQWQAANPEKVTLTRREAHRRRNARMSSGKVSYRRILERDGPWCGICGHMIIAASLDEIHFDHIIPLSKGGPHTEANIQVSHAQCNLRKHANLPP